MSPVQSNWLAFARETAVLAGQIMLQYVGVKVGLVTKRDGSLVTLADQAISEMVISRVQKHFPTHGVLGEEKSYSPANVSYTWVCDPIDGTLPFCLGIPTNVFSLALTNKDGEPIVAVVYDPYKDCIYEAVTGAGARMNNAPLRVCKVATLADAVIGMSGRHSNLIKIDAFRQAVGDVCYRPLQIYSVVYEAMLVAAGQIAACLYMGTGAHDVAAARLIVEEAGGRVTSLGGDEQKYNQSIQGAIISNGLVQGQLLSIARRYMH